MLSPQVLIEKRKSEAFLKNPAHSKETKSLGSHKRDELDSDKRYGSLFDRSCSLMSRRQGVWASDVSLSRLLAVHSLSSISIDTQ